MPLIAARDGGAKVTVIIPNFNGQRYLYACLQSVVRECRALDASAAVLVVDNGSVDGSVDYIRRQFPSVDVLALAENRGFAEACDIGIIEAKSEYCFLLNNDAWCERGALGYLLEYADQGDYAIVGPALLNPDGSPQWPPLSIDFMGYAGAAPAGQPAFLVVGAALLLRRDDYLRLGGFDRRFFAFYEETDLQWRAHLYGLKVGQTFDARVFHIGGGTLAGSVVRAGDAGVMNWGRQYMARRNQLASVLINYSYRSLIWVLPTFIVLTAIECLGMILTGHSEQVGAYAAAGAWNVQHLGGTLRRRRKVQAGRCIPDREIRRKFVPPLSRLRSLVGLARAGTKITFA